MSHYTVLNLAFLRFKVAVSTVYCTWYKAICFVPIILIKTERMNMIWYMVQFTLC